ncbi:unnamed protein product [Symbiodinium sp. CCMP2456]|nr:unnamed protein product [Symbiodinium sp. CCMP2456]
MASITQWPYGYCLRMPAAPGVVRQYPQLWPSQAVLVQQRLRYEAQEFVPSKPTTNQGNPVFMFASPSASVGGGCSTKSTEDGGDSCKEGGAVQPEASQPVGEDGDVHFGVQAMQQKKSGKRLINARLPLKRQGAKQQEVSCLPAEEWGLRALDAVEVTVQSRCLEAEITRTLQADGAGDPPAPEPLSGEPEFIPATPCAVAQATGWRLRTRSDESGVEVERMLQLDPTAMDLVSGDRSCCPASEAAEAEPNTYGIIEFKNSHMHDEKKHDPAIARSSQVSIEEQQVADVDIWASPAFTDVAHDGSEDSVALQSSPTTSPAASSVLGAPSLYVQPDDTLPFLVEPGVEYDRGWVKYKDPESGEIWFHNELTDDYFFAQYSRQWGWLPYESKIGQRWWWHDKRKSFFFEGLK